MTVGWVIGRRGLLGASTHDAMLARDRWAAIAVDSLPWDHPEDLEEEAAKAFGALVAESARLGQPWSVLWLAGAGVTHSSEESFALELNGLRAVLSGCRRHIGTTDHTGVFFYASSAGGVYAGASGSPYSEFTPVAPISPYGRFKVEAERLVVEFAQACGVSSLVGRIANVYGPGQRLEKMQGLISQLARAQYSDHPATIYVPLDTIRDYLYSDDCAALILDACERAETEGRGGPIHVAKILASGDGVTVGSLLGEIKLVTKRAPNVMLANSSSAAFQSSDLRFRSVVWPELDARELTPLPAGIRSTLDAVLARIQEPRSRGV